MATKDSPMNRATAAEIKAERMAQGIDNAKLAELSGVPVATLNRISSKLDLRDINVSQLAAIAGALKVPTAELIHRAEKRAQRLAEEMSVVEGENVLAFPKPKTAAEFDAYEGDSAAHEFDPEADAPED